MGSCVSSRRRFDEVCSERDELRRQIRRVHLYALEESQFVTEFTAEEAKARWKVLDSDLELVLQTRPGLYSITDLRRLQDAIGNERDERAGQEARKFGIDFPGITALEMCGWRGDYALREDPAHDEKELKRAALRAARLTYLDRKFQAIGGSPMRYTFGYDVADPTRKWPAVWPWRREAVLAPEWVWTADAHAYWFGPQFHDEARALLMSVRERRIVPLVLTRLAKMHAADK